MSQTSSPTALQPNPGVVARRMGDGAVLVHLPTNRIFELNDTAARVWELIGDGLDHTHIISRLTEEFDVDEARATSELQQLVEQFRVEGFLR